MQELERLASLGLKGIKLHPEYQGFFADSPESVAVVKKAAELGLWVLLHAGEDIGMPPPVHCAPVHSLRLCEAVPQARIILAHFGGYRQWEQVEEALPELCRYTVLLDTSFCLPNERGEWDRFARLVRGIGPERVLFGSDSPWGDQSQALAAAREFLDAYGFTPEERDAVLGGNAARILSPGGRP